MCLYSVISCYSEIIEVNYKIAIIQIQLYRKRKFSIYLDLLECLRE
jgi:hypothetical protein